MKRRSFIRGTMAVSIGSVMTASETRAARNPRVESVETKMQGDQAMAQNAAHFFNDEDLNYVFLIMLGGTYYRAAEVGECLAIAAQITDGDAASVVQALTTAGERVAALADKGFAAGQRLSASQAYMRAANYIFSATYFLDRMGAPDRFAATWLRHQELWDQAAALFDPPMEHVAIPYEGVTLPGFFFTVDGSATRRPLLILNNGSDGGMIAAWTLGVAPALERGYNCLTFYGPGQGTALLHQRLYFRPDWEKVMTPVVDYALTRSEVDPARIALVGISQGGYWAPRAAAFEPRIAAVVADPGVWEVGSAWIGKLPQPMRALLASGRKEQFDQFMHEGVQQDRKAAAMLTFRMRPFGFSSPYDTYKAVEQYTLAAIADHIRCPTLITDPEGEQFWPGQSQRLYDALHAPKSLVKFTAVEGADLHCEPKTPGLRAQRIFDWLGTTLQGSRQPLRR